MLSPSVPSVLSLSRGAEGIVVEICGEGKCSGKRALKTKHHHRGEAGTEEQSQKAAKREPERSEEVRKGDDTLRLGQTHRRTAQAYAAGTRLEGLCDFKLHPHTPGLGQHCTALTVEQRGVDENPGVYV